MIFTYVLTSTNADYYIEQALMSMYSLKMHNPEARIALVTDEATVKTLDGTRAAVRQYVDEMVVIATPEEYNAKLRSRYIKTTLRSRLKGDFMYIDTDTIITAPLSGLEDLVEHDIYATLNAHIPDSYKISSVIKEYNAVTGQKFSLTHPYYNGGVFLVRDTPGAHKFFDDWHEIWNRERVKFGVSRDQMALAKANELNGGIVKELPAAYNCQIVMPQAWKHFIEAKVIHYYAESPYPFYMLKKRTTFEKVKRGGITPEIAEMIMEIKQQYLLSCRLMTEEDWDNYNLPMAVLGRKLARDYKWTNRFARVFYKIVGGVKL